MYKTVVGLFYLSRTWLRKTYCYRPILLAVTVFDGLPVLRIQSRVQDVAVNSYLNLGPDNILLLAFSTVLMF